MAQRASGATTFPRVARYTLVRAAVLSVTAIVAVYLAILVANLGGFVDQIVESNIHQAIAGMRLGGWLRATAEDVEQAFKLVPEIKDLNLSISTSSQMVNGKFLGAKSQEDILAMAMEAIDVAKVF